MLANNDLASRVVDDCDLMLYLTVYQQPCVRIPRIHEMLSRQKALRGEVLMNDHWGIKIGGRGGGGQDMRDQVGVVIVAGLSQMHLVAQPIGCALGAIARLDIVGGSLSVRPLVAALLDSANASVHLRLLPRIVGAIPDAAFRPLATLVANWVHHRRRWP